jgi:RNA polymerase sigma-70 factor (ECF subfamily)
MDPDLVVQTQRGDVAAFESLMVASHHRLFRVAQGILRDPYLAEDATQQAFLDIWRDIRRLRDPSRFEGWSYRLLVRVCYAEAKRKRYTVLETEMQSHEEPLAADAFDAVVDRDELERAFQHLSVEHRTVIVLHHLLDLTLEQTAAALDVPLGTVHSRVSRAMEALRVAMEAEVKSDTLVPLRQEAVR